MSKKKTIFSALPIVAAAYGEKLGVKVCIGSTNDTAYTDGETIVVPNIPDDYPNMDAVWGYLAHEAGHVRFTDFTVERKPGLHSELCNILEDPRIEREMMNIFPGTVQTLAETTKYMIQNGHYEHVTDQDGPASILQAYCLYWLCVNAVGQTSLQDHLDQAKSVFERIFPQGVVVRLNVLLRKAISTTSTEDVSRLSFDIMKMIEEEQEKEQEKEQGQQGADQSQQNAGNNQPQDGQGSESGDDQGQGQGQGQGDGQDKSQGNANGQNQDGQQSQDQGQNQGQDGQSQSQSQSQGQNSDTPSGVLQQVLSAGSGDFKTDRYDSLKAELTKAGKNGDSSYKTIKSAREVVNNEALGRNLLDNVMSTTSKVRAQLYGLVQASQRVGHRNKRSGNRIDTNKVCRVVGGDTKIFRQSADKVRPNTAVHILVDMSSSMEDAAANGVQRQHIARDSALALSVALDSIPGVNPAVTFFCSNDMYSVVKHGKPVKQQAGKFHFAANGGTPMAEAIWYGAYELSKTREERKMLIVVTDGEPNSRAATTSVIDLCESSDIEVIGIGIETHAVNSLFKTNIVIDDASDLQRTLFKLMERSLTGSAA